MKYYSTNKQAPLASLEEAVVKGLASDKGLFMPMTIRHLPQEFYDEIDSLSFQEIAYRVADAFFGEDVPTEILKEIVYDTLNFDVPLVQVKDNIYSLELFHGPTLAFKDVGGRFMARLLSYFIRKEGRKQVNVLVATSGDTGKAALEGFRDVAGTEIMVFYPQDGVSPMQERQMNTQEGGNVHVCAIQGNFDDAQTGVKKVFGDKAIAARLAERNIRLSSANSINWGRLVPQIVYYFAAYAQLLKAGKITFGDKVDFCVPTGNFGDILAGYYAKQMGLPVGKLVCASNQNNVLTDFLSTGTYTAKREFYKTTSPSMDILVSSNLERLLYHVTGSDAEVAGLMKSLNETGRYTVRPETLKAIQESFDCGWSSEEQVAGEIRARYEKDGYLCDTHTAVAFHVAAQKKRDGVPMVVLSTASPFKFPRSVLEALGHTAPENDFEAMQALEEATGRTAPASLAVLRQKAERFSTVIDPAQIAEVALGCQA